MKIFYVVTNGFWKRSTSEQTVANTVKKLREHLIKILKKKLFKLFFFSNVLVTLNAKHSGFSKTVFQAESFA